MEKQLVPARDRVLQQTDLADDYFLDYELKKVIPVKIKSWGNILFIVLSVLTGGLLALIFHWCSLVWKSLRYQEVTADQAESLICITEFDEEQVIDIVKIKDDSGNEIQVVEFRLLKFNYDQSTKRWIMVRNYLKATNEQIRQSGVGLNQEFLPLLRRFYGSNTTKVEVDSIWSLFVGQVLTTFNLYQLFACIIWIFRNYAYYSALIFVCVVVTMIYTIWVIRSEQHKMNSMADSSTVRVHRKNQQTGVAEIMKISSTELLPGDVFEVNANEKLPCDAIVAEGQLLIDESALTGESVPMHKTQVPKNASLFSDKEKGHILYSGTLCLTSESIEHPNDPALAVVLQTGFNTTKGLLIRSIKFNEPGMYKFEKDGNFFLLYLIMISCCFIAIYYIVIYTSYDDPVFSEIWLPSIDIMLTMVPPGLSLCLTLGVQYAQGRLASKKVSAVKGRLINAAGRMKVVFFDKTGTLTITQVKLSATGVYLADIQTHKDQCQIVTAENGVYVTGIKQAGRDKELAHLLHNFAADHTLVRTKDGQILGDPLEEELLNYAGASISDEIQEHAKSNDLPEPSDEKAVKSNKQGMKTMKIQRGQASNKLKILEVYGFKAELQRMSVIVQDESDNQIIGYMKGAPEKIVALCAKDSLPTQVEKQMNDFAKKGFRVIAFATTHIPTNTPQSEYNRDVSEKNPRFQGFALFENNLKEMTKPTLQNLKKADFRTGMITGDNINTAISVAKTSGIIDIERESIMMCTYKAGSAGLTAKLIDEFGDPQTEIDLDNKEKHASKPPIGAMASTDFAAITDHFKLELTKPIDISQKPLMQIAQNIRVFARMNPEQKAMIVKIMKAYYKDYEYTVGFCGDGANDCIALKHADIGVSLSKTEASLSAPFVSQIEDISCIECISYLGKSALTTNFDCFRYFCLYSIIQTLGLIILYSQKTEYSIGMYLTMDIPIALNLANSIGLLTPFHHLTVALPYFTLMNFKFLLSVILNACYAAAFMLFGVFVLIRKDANFVSAPDLAASTLESGLPTFESTVISMLAIQGTWHIAISFSLAGEFKDRFYKSYYMGISIALYIIWCFYLLFNDGLDWGKFNEYWMTAYNFVYFQNSTRWYVFLEMLIFAILSIVTEVLIVWVIPHYDSTFRAIEADEKKRSGGSTISKESAAQPYSK
jgi:predicted P-type ATPase